MPCRCSSQQKYVPIAAETTLQHTLHKQALHNQCSSWIGMLPVQTASIDAGNHTPHVPRSTHFSQGSGSPGKMCLNSNIFRPDWLHHQVHQQISHHLASAAPVLLVLLPPPPPSPSSSLSPSSSPLPSPLPSPSHPPSPTPSSQSVFSFNLEALSKQEGGGQGGPGREKDEIRGEYGERGCVLG